MNIPPEVNSIRTGWHKDFRVNASRGWQEKLADFVRWIADEIDGRTSLAVRITTIPVLSKSIHTKCLSLGLEHASLLITDSLRDACYDDIKGYLDPAANLDVQEDST